PLAGLEDGGGLPADLLEVLLGRLLLPLRLGDDLAADLGVLRLRRGLGRLRRLDDRASALLVLAADGLFERGEPRRDRRPLLLLVAVGLGGAGGGAPLGVGLGAGAVGGEADQVAQRLALAADQVGFGHGGLRRIRSACRSRAAPGSAPRRAPASRSGRG